MAHEYPLEYVLRHLPVMMVAGLAETASTPLDSPNRVDDAPARSSSLVPLADAYFQAVRQKVASIFTGRNATSVWEGRHSAPHQQQLIKIGNGTPNVNLQLPPGASLFHTVLVDKVTLQAS